MKKAAIIIVNWNGQRLLNDCLTAVYKQTYKNHVVYFVDNGSQDDSVAYVKSNFPDAKVISLTENTGYARGNNEGIRLAVADPSIAYIVCLNNDTIVDQHWLSELVKTAEGRKEIGAVTSKAYFDDGITIQNAGLEFYPALQTNKKGGLSIGFGKTDTEATNLSYDQEVFAPGGVAPLYKREVVEKILSRDGEFFDEDYFAYAEDYDVGFRIRKVGYVSFLSANAKLIHLHSKTAGVASPFKAYYSERNTILTAVKNLSFWQLFLFPFRNVILKLSYLQTKNDSVKKLSGNIGTLRMVLLVLKANLVAVWMSPKFFRKRFNMKRNANK